MANGFGLDGGERLPWLEAVEDEDEELGGGLGRLLLVFVGVLAAIALIVGGVVFFRHHQAATADIGGIIHAPDGPYKERPKDPGGMKLSGAGDVAYGTSTGQDIDSAIDLTAVPETPVAGPNRAPRDATPLPPLPTPAAAAKAPAPARKENKPIAVIAATAKADAPVRSKPVPADVTAATAPVATVQLGAFSSEAKARGAWKSLTARFANLDALDDTITEVTSSDSATLYRLRATGPGAGRICATLKVAGETCASVGE